MLRADPDPLKSPAYRAGAATLFAAAGVILAALAFEHLGGYEPCPLCVQQRYAYYFAIPTLFVALMLVAAERTRLAAALFLAVALAFGANAALGSYQAGAEWKLWPGPESCAASSQPLSNSVDELAKRLAETRPVACDVPSWMFLGLSFAGWNAVASLFLALGALRAAAGTATIRA
jgi:disulfide bond formation protein DsbB